MGPREEGAVRFWGGRENSYNRGGTGRGLRATLLSRNLKYWACSDCGKSKRSEKQWVFFEGKLKIGESSVSLKNLRDLRRNTKPDAKFRQSALELSEEKRKLSKKTKEI